MAAELTELEKTNARSQACGAEQDENLSMARQVSQIYEKNYALKKRQKTELWEAPDLDEAFWKCVDDLKKAQQGQTSSYSTSEPI